MENRRALYKTFFSIYFILVLQNMVSLAIDLTDNMMLGSWSETAMSAVAAVNQIQFVFQQIVLALCEALILFAGQYWGKQNKEKIKEFFSASLLTAVLFSFFLFLVVSVFPNFLVSRITADTRIVILGVRYLNIVKYTYVLFAVSMSVLAALKSVEVVRIGFVVSLISFFVNILLNYALIYGNFGFKAMGVEGAAIATLCSRLIEMTAILIFAFGFEKKLKLDFKAFFCTQRKVYAAYLDKASSMIVIALLWGINTAMQTVVMGHMSSYAIAANSIASVLFLMVKGAAKGAAATGAIIISKSIGMGDLNKVKIISKQLQILFFLLALSGGILLFMIRMPILKLYDMSSETAYLANAFLIILSFTYVAMAYQMPVSEGIIKAAGEIGFVLKMNIISSYFIVLPLAWYLAFYARVSPVIVIFVLNSDQFFKCFPVFLKVNRGEWIHELTG